MKLKMKFSAGSALFLLVLLMNSATTAQVPQEQRTFSFDTGVLTLNNPDQFLRATIDWGDGSATPASVRFRQVGYIEEGNIYRVASVVTTDPLTVTAGEAAHFDINQRDFNAVRGMILVGAAKVDAARARVTVQIISSSTGQVESVLVALLIP